MSTPERRRRFAPVEAHGRSPVYEESSIVYEESSIGIAEDRDVLELVERLPEPKPQPNPILGAARYLGAPPASYRSFRRWILENRPATAAPTRGRATRTNEAGRCAVLLPARRR